MEQERSIYQLNNVSKLTGELFLKSLVLFLEKTADAIQEMRNRPITQEAKWHKFMATDAPKEVKQFRTSEINLDQLRKVLNLYDVGFTFQPISEDGTTALAYEAKNRSVIEKAFEELLDRATQPEKAKTLTDLLTKAEPQKSFEDRLEQAQVKAEKLAAQQVKEEGLQKVTKKVEEVSKV